MKTSNKFSGGSQSAGINKKFKCSGGSHSARTLVKTQDESTGMSYIKTMYVGITKKELRDGIGFGAHYKRPYDIVSIGSGDSHPAGMTSFSIDLSSLQ